MMIICKLIAKNMDSFNFQDICTRIESVSEKFRDRVRNAISRYEEYKRLFLNLIRRHSEGFEITFSGIFGDYFNTHKDYQVTFLDLRDEKIDDAVLRSLVQALNSSGCELRALGLSDNEIYITGAVRKLAEFLKSPNCKLTSLDLSDNDINDDELQGLAEALISPNCRLTSLNLSNNKKIIGSKFLLDLTGRDCKLTSLNLSNNLLFLCLGSTPYNFLVLLDFLNSPSCKVTSLNLSSNFIGDNLAKALAEFLKSPNCKLTSLELGGNKIGDVGLQKLAEAVVVAKHSSPERVIKIKGLPDFDRYLAMAEENFGRQVQAHESAVAVTCPCCT